MPAFALSRIRDFLSNLAEQSAQSFDGFSPASGLRAEILQIVLGLLLGVLGCSLGVRAGIQLMNRFVQALGLVTDGALAAGKVRIGLYAGYLSAQAVKLHTKIVARVE